MNSTTPRLRFAPSPTGYLHVGGARTALFNWLYARKYGGAFLLRVEDTDKARSTEESTRAIFEGLRWLGLDWDEEVVFQGANLERHRRDAYALLERGLAYRDFTTAQQLDELRSAAEARGEAFRFDRRMAELPDAEVAERLRRGDPFTIRFRVPEGSTTWDDLVHGPITFPNKDVDDFIILRSDGTPIYNHAVVSDDIAMGITVVMRGDDHISNTPKQILLYHALGAALPEFAHIPMILGTDGKKLSKRHGAMAVGDYQHLGILPSAMRNFLALLGWSPGGDREVMSQEEMIALFSREGLLKKAAVFDLRKLEWMNGQHMMQTPIEELEAYLRPFVVAAGLASEEELAARRAWWLHLLELLRVRARTVNELVKLARPYFSVTVAPGTGELRLEGHAPEIFVSHAMEYDEAAVAKHWKDKAGTSELLDSAATTLAGLEWTAASLEPALRGLAESRGIGTGKLFQPLRVALTGMAESPGIFDVLVVLGREESLGRLHAAVARLRGGA
jgi:glutamyl-tRNA synthetase